jgi:hypothetical protein
VDGRIVVDHENAVVDELERIDHCRPIS